MSEEKKITQSLLKTNSELAKEWDYEKNAPFSPNDFSARSSRNVWWHCSKGHQWEASINHRAQRGDGCPFCSNRRLLVGYNDISTVYPDISKEWNYEKNRPFTPEDFSISSGAKVWWKCSKGHEWETKITNRTIRKYGCPYCSGKYVEKGKTDLITAYPNLVKEWDYEKNGTLTPDSIKSGSSKEIWWKCEKEHSWKACVRNRAKGSGCPYCAGIKAIKGENDLASTYPDLIKEWNYQKNHDILPDSIKAGSNKKVWWVCTKGHEWEAVIASRTKLKSSCPYCSGKRAITGETDLATVFPELINEWDFEKNAALNPLQLSAGSDKKVWWKCSKCGNQWQTTISSRTKNGNGCPICGRKKAIGNQRKRIIKAKGSLLETHPALCAEWNTNRNDTTPGEYSYGSKMKVWWICKKGHEWEAAIYSRVNGCGCPKCNMGHRVSLPEKAIVFYLHQCNLETIENARIFENSLRDVDIFLPTMNCAIEYDGEHWHKSKRKDFEKTGLCKALGIHLIRIREPKIGMLNDGYSEEKITGIPKNDLCYINESIKWLLRRLGVYHINVDANRDMPLIRAMIEKTYEDDSFGYLYPEIASEWDPIKNGNLAPEDISKCSGIKAWWLCSNRHSWQDSVAHRISGRGCPYCSGRKTLPGYNDLKTRHPDIAKEWDYEKNGSLDPTTISDCNARKVWWICNKGHSYLASIAHRTSANGTNCPYCTNQKALLGYNDLLTIDPIVASEWNYERNGELKPVNMVFASNKKVWWRCSCCGYQWKAIVSSRTRSKSGCPLCSKKKSTDQHRRTVVNKKGSIKERYPVLLEEWNYELNTDKKPEAFPAGSNEKVWWKCKKCNNIWQATIANRTMGHGCPACAIRNRASKKNKAVLCIETNTTYDSVNSAAVFCAVSPSKISACCRGKQKTAGVYHWMYIVSFT